MKALITKADVQIARDALLAKGKQPGPRTIFNHLGKGSLTTVTRLLREIEAEAPRPEKQPELQEAFRTFWAIATGAGREEAEAQIKELNETQLGLLEDNERLQAELVTAQERTSELEKSLSGLTHDLRGALEAAEKARASAETYSARYETALERMERLQAEHLSAMNTQKANADAALAEARDLIKKLQSDLEILRGQKHELEISLTRAETKLESKS